jgi:hypothetical protein
MAFDPGGFISSVVLAMKITNKHKAYAVVLGLGLAALGFDRGLSRPESADAAPVLAEAVNSGTITSGDATGGTVAGSSNAVIAAHLQAEQQGLNAAAMNNPFVPSKAWLAAQQANTPDTSASAAQFTRGHILSAILHSKKGGQALINGRLFRAGQLVDGMRIIAIGLDSVRMGDASGQFDLAMPTAVSSSDIQAD